MNLKRYLIPAVLLIVVLAQFVPAAGMAPKTAAAAAACDWAQFVADVTIPDGTSMAAGAAFTKTWRLKNVGTCSWSTAYALVYSSGEKMGTTTVVNLPSNVAPGATVDLTVNMTAPSTAGHYRGYWQLRNASGVLFGIGATAASPFWVDINVTQTYATAYDFAANYCSAAWSTGAGAAACPGTEGSASGFVVKQDAPRLENGATDTAPGLLVAPQAVAGGYIRGVFPAFTVQTGDRFQSIVNCSYGATTCYVRFRLDYQIAGGAVRTLWSFRERYEGMYYRVNLDLSALAGQSVTFILYTEDVAGYGVPSGDRALWGAPKIVRTGTGPIITPTFTPTVGPSPTPTATGPAPATTCNRAQFLADVTIPDGTILAANTPFTKTWRLKNVGTCTWTTSYSIYFVSGDQMGAPASVVMPSNVAPGQTVDISVPMTAPATAGHYKGYWKLRNASGASFGVWSNYNNPIWADINVTASVAGAAYDFTANACSATWTSAAGALPCPGTDGNASGFVLKPGAPKLEDGTTGLPGLLTAPQNVTDGYIQGIYPAFTVQSGDKFQSVISCEYGATSCYVTFRLDYQVGSGPIQTFWFFRERYDNLYYRASVDLTPLAGQNVKFILTVLAYGSATGDRAMWVAPQIVRVGGSVPPTNTPTATATATAIATATATATNTPLPSETPTPTSTP